MGVYSAGWSHVGINTADQVYANLNNTGTAQRLKIREIGVNISVAPTTAPLFYLVRCTARGTQTATLLGLPHDPADGAATGTVDSTWSAQPTKAGTVTTAPLSVLGLPVTAGGLLIWTFYDNPLVIPATSGLGIGLANSVASGATTGTFNGYFKWEE